MIAGGILSGINAVSNIIGGGKMKRQGNALLGSRGDIPMYQESPYAKQQLGLATQLFNGRMAGAPELERNIYNNQANFMDNVGRNATDSSQALALAAAGQGQTNNAFGNLQIQEAQNKNNMLDNLNRAYGQMIGEGDKVFNSKSNRYNLLTQEGYGLKGAGMQTANNGMNDLAGSMFGLGQLGLGKNLFGKRASGMNTGFSGFSFPNSSNV